MSHQPKGVCTKQGNSLFNRWKSVQSVDSCVIQDELNDIQIQLAAASFALPVDQS